MRRLAFSIFAYVIAMTSLAAYFWMIQFGFQRGQMPEFSWTSLLIDCCLFAVFPLQHSILARRKWKDAIGNLMGQNLERSFYVLTSGIAMWIVLLGWRPFGPYLYNFPRAIVFDIIFFLSLSLILLSTIALDHSAMFGLKQGYAAWKHSEIPDKDLQTDGLYGIVRHPITSLLIIALWSHRSLTAGKFLFSILFSIYAIAGTWFEERDLIRIFGDRYRAYKEKVPAFIPGLRAK